MEITSLIILGVIGLAVILAVYVLIKSSSKKISSAEQLKIKKQWNQIIDEYKKNPNTAVLEADKLLSHVLELLGYEGSVGEKLKKSSALFKNLNDVWTAHKLRNRIAHEMGLKINQNEAKSALNIFKNALKDLGANI